MKHFDSSYNSIFAVHVTLLRRIILMLSALTLVLMPAARLVIAQDITPEPSEGIILEGRISNDPDPELLRAAALAPNKIAGGAFEALTGVSLVFVGLGLAAGSSVIIPILIIGAGALIIADGSLRMFSGGNDITNARLNERAFTGPNNLTEVIFGQSGRDRDNEVSLGIDLALAESRPDLFAGLYNYILNLVVETQMNRVEQQATTVAPIHDEIDNHSFLDDLPETSFWTFTDYVALSGCPDGDPQAALQWHFDSTERVTPLIKFPDNRLQFSGFGYSGWDNYWIENSTNIYETVDTNSSDPGDYTVLLLTFTSPTTMTVDIQEPAYWNGGQVQCYNEYRIEGERTEAPY